MIHKIQGLLLLAGCIGIIVLASQGTTAAERNVTPVLLLAPIGVHLLLLDKKKKAAPGLDNWKSGYIHPLKDAPIIPRPSGRGKGVWLHG